MADRHLASESRFVLRFFSVAVVLFSLAGGMAYGLIHFAGPTDVAGAFAVSTALLLIGSVALQNAHQQVKRERQRQFRISLLVGLTAGTLFLAVQSFGLWSLLHIQDPLKAQTGSEVFVLVFAVSHALHLSIALLFLTYVTMKAFADRYDHEYYWVITACACFWHFLGLAWLFILGVFTIRNIA